ncbi:hypothetical protein SpCBS45565_g02180 [Spizellomyces sp. 'palustris']|nr:hypothetical protein SpCBS45565_g02180 [Spizellomyces sp. 'palustris']
MGNTGSALSDPVGPNPAVKGTPSTPSPSTPSSREHAKDKWDKVDVEDGTRARILESRELEEDATVRFGMNGTSGESERRSSLLTVMDGVIDGLFSAAGSVRGVGGLMGGDDRVVPERCASGRESEVRLPGGYKNAFIKSTSYTHLNRLSGASRELDRMEAGVPNEIIEDLGSRLSQTAIDQPIPQVFATPQVQSTIKVEPYGIIEPMSTGVDTTLVVPLTHENTGIEKVSEKHPLMDQSDSLVMTPYMQDSDTDIPKPDIPTNVVGSGFITPEPTPSTEHPPTPNAPKLSRIAKYNSCSTLFVEATISNADLNDTLRCVASALVNHMKKNLQDQTFKTDNIFSEELHPLSQHIQFYRRMPKEDDIFKFLECLFNAAELTAECGIITLVYVERMLQNTSLTLHASNWTRIVLGGLLLASKVWDDHAVWNVDFVQIFPEVDVEDMNQLERWYMAALDFDVNIKASEYARYYFSLRDLAEKSRRRWPLKPLTLRDAAKLEARTARPPPKLDTSTPNTPDTIDPRSSPPRTIHAFEREGATNVGGSNGGMRRSMSDYIFVGSKPPAMVV